MTIYSNVYGLLMFPCADGEKEAEMSEVMKVLEKAAEAMIAGDKDLYLSLISDRSREVIEDIGDIDSMFELASMGVEILGEEGSMELTLAAVDQYKLVDGRLENISLESVYQTQAYDKATSMAREGLEELMEMIKKIEDSER